jgi:hypothetical protein
MRRGTIHVDFFLTLNPVKIFSPGLAVCGKRRAVMFPAHGAVTVTDVGDLAVNCVADFATQTSTLDHVAPPRLDV